ncbi:MAG TPA: tRNA (adenosine(37)-N6)-threonylcarbamoyltransferase complex dimerization subunit type 1 TsaB [Terriglobales bacterium]|nr:tRNA (adenosine(37)-N6)-threonylcarbamoyltransferase complex dimerization subunit type 1 TsaB [Terriglobales bacterium]
MLLLATDTSGKFGSIALAQCGPADTCEVLEIVPLEGGTFSAQLVPQIASLLSKHGFGKQNIDAFAVASGPGSFTGLRVGLAAIKALAEILNKPIVPVSLLEAVAVSTSGAGKVFAALDAGRGEVYVGEYENSSGLHSERLLSRQEMLAAADRNLIVTPDAGLAEFARAAGFKVQEIERPQSDAIARLAWRKLEKKETVAPEVLDANYIRRSDAEIFSSK